MHFPAIYGYIYFVLFVGNLIKRKNVDSLLEAKKIAKTDINLVTKENVIKNNTGTSITPVEYKVTTDSDGKVTKTYVSAGVGDEGGFAPDLASDEEAIQYISEAVKNINRLSR